VNWEAVVPSPMTGRGVVADWHHSLKKRPSHGEWKRGSASDGEYAGGLFRNVPLRNETEKLGRWMERY